MQTGRGRSGSCSYSSPFCCTPWLFFSILCPIGTSDHAICGLVLPPVSWSSSYPALSYLTLTPKTVCLQLPASVSISPILASWLYSPHQAVMPCRKMPWFQTFPSAPYYSSSLCSDLLWEGLESSKLITMWALIKSLELPLNNLTNLEILNKTKKWTSNSCPKTPPSLLSKTATKDGIGWNGTSTCASPACTSEFSSQTGAALNKPTRPLTLTSPTGSGSGPGQGLAGSQVSSTSGPWSLPGSSPIGTGSSNDNH